VTELRVIMEQTYHLIEECFWHVYSACVGEASRDDFPLDIHVHIRTFVFVPWLSKGQGKGCYSSCQSIADWCPGRPNMLVGDL